MLKNELIDLIKAFEKETWKYDANDSLDNDMQYIYSIEKEIQEADESNLQSIYDRLLSMIGIIRFKYGFESMIVNSIPELESLKKIIEGISFSDDDFINQYNYVSTVYGNCINNIKNADFIRNKHKGVQGKEGLYLAIESLKSLINNDNYRQLLDKTRMGEILIDCIKLNNGVLKVEQLESKYESIIRQIWQKSLSDTIDNKGDFRILFSNISGGSLSEQAENLVNRQYQSSCSMISSNFIATYGDETRKIGFIYPSNSNILMASAYDLGSNVFGEGVVNRDKGTIIATPQALEDIGIERTNNKGEDVYSSSCYDEILVNTKPCGIVVIGLGEKDLNIDYQESQNLSSKMNLPIYYIDTMQYKNHLSEADKSYISFHSLMSFLGMSRDDLLQEIADNDGQSEVYNLIDDYKEQIAEAFITMKKEGSLNKESMCQEMENIIDFSKTRVIDK